MDNLTPDQIKQMISMLSAMLPQDAGTNDDDEFVSSIKTKKVTSKKSNFKNKFLEMSEKNLHKEDTEIDKLLSVTAPTPRNRNNSTVKVRCRVCGKQEDISASLVLDKDRYKCNKCCSGAG